MAETHVDPPVRPDEVRHVTCIGAGVIGGGWAAHYLARGYDVTVWDPATDAEQRVRRVVDAAWGTLQDIGLAEGASQQRLWFASSLEESVADAHVVQESAPERLDLKIALLADLDTVTPPGVVITSSTSGYSMSEMQVQCSTPERLVVGHPFNPPYLIPLVEVVGGDKSADTAVEWAAQFYRHAGKRVIRMDHEVPGFIANRLQEAVWREALHMVANDEATVQQIDAAMTDGPGLRWPLMGPCLTFHLAGGDGGMAHMLDHFGPSLAAPWTRLEAPELTPDLREKMVDGSEAEAGGRSIAELVAERDRGLLAVLRAQAAARNPGTANDRNRGTDDGGNGDDPG